SGPYLRRHNTSHRNQRSGQCRGHPLRFKESFLWAAAKGGRVEECESLVKIG
ncbi:unnamed protein product, partial [Ascophyllum nodosum]